MVINMQKILIIGDNHYIPIDILTAQNFETIVINNMESIQQVRSINPNLILLNIKNSKIVGYKNCEYLKANNQTKDIPVIFIGGLSIAFDKIQAFNVGGVDYITEPLQIEEVLVRIKTHIRLRSLQQNLETKNRQLEIYAKQLKESQKEKLYQLNQAYGRFVPRQFLSLLEKEHITDIQLGDQAEQKMTILFADIREFTTLSETMNPQENFNFINAFLGKMEPVITKHYGFIDKYIGDAIMALFTSVDDAIRAGIDMLKTLADYNKTRGRPNRPIIKIGIGINTGSLMLGIIGGKNRMEGTVISDAVNIASRLENLTKVYHTPLLISEASYLKSTDASQYHIRLLDQVKVKGKSDSVKVFEVFNADSTEMIAAKLDTLKQFEQAVNLYQQQNFVKAQELFQICMFDETAAVYAQRCQKFLNVNTSTRWEEIADIVNWTPELSINHDLIDKQHQELFIRMKDLIMSIGNENNSIEVAKMIDFLGEYVVIHFSTEEELMQKFNYVDFALHKAQHQRFIQRFSKLEADYKARGGRLYLTLQIQEELINWLLNHIAGSDQKLAIFLQQA